MISLHQQQDFSLGAAGAPGVLAKKDSARLIVVSDSHGSPGTLSAILAQFGRGADALCFCGDGMPDLLQLLERRYADGALADVPPVLFFVQGNNDNSTYQLRTDERQPIFVPGEQQFLAAGTRIFMTHGHRFDVYYGGKALAAHARSFGADIALYGHTHISNLQARHGLTLLNPGSCALPRSGLPQTFALIDLARGTKPVFTYHEIRWDKNGDIGFAPYAPSTGEINLFW